MNLSRLTRTTQQQPLAATEHANRSDVVVRRVEQLAGVEGDRPHSLQQDIAEMQAAALSDFHGQERIFEEAHDVAVQLRHRAAPFEQLVLPGALAQGLPGVDASV